MRYLDRSWWPPLILTALVLVNHTASHDFAGVWQSGWTTIAVFAALSGAWLMWINHMKAYAPMFLWVCLSGIGVGMVGIGYPMEGVKTWPAGSLTNASVSTSVRFFTLEALAIFLAFVALSMAMTKKGAQWLTAWLSVAGLVAALSIIVERAMHHPVQIQVMIGDNPSMTACFATMGLLYWLLEVGEKWRGSRYYDDWKMLLPTQAFIAIVLVEMIVLVGRHTPVTVFVAGAWVVLVKRWPSTVINVTVFVVSFCYFYFGPSVDIIAAASSGRWADWTVLYGYWSESWARMIFGTGIGTCTMLQPLLTVRGTIFSHSSIGQIPLELGMIGSFLALVVVVRIFWGLRDSTSMQALFAAYLACGLTNFPDSSPIHALFLLAIVRRSV